MEVQNKIEFIRLYNPTLNKKKSSNDVQFDILNDSQKCNNGVVASLWLNMCVFYLTSLPIVMYHSLITNKAGFVRGQENSSVIKPFKMLSVSSMKTFVFKLKHSLIVYL